MKWRVQLSGDNSDLEELSKSFSSDRLRICRDGETYILSSLDFVVITEADIVLKKSQEILDFINGGSAVIQKLAKPIQVGSIQSIDDEGKRNTYIFAESIPSRSAVFRTTVLVKRKVQGTFIFEGLPNWVLLASQNKSVADVLRHLKTGSNDIGTLYKVYEIIKVDVGGKLAIRDKGWASRNRIDRFTRTVQSPAAIGDKARHGVQQTQPPEAPMLLDEAASFVLHLAKCWLNSKINH